MNAVVIEEDRTFVDKIKDKIEKTRADYQKNVVDTGKSDEIDKKIEKRAETTKKTIKVAGTVATVLLMICPADGPLGEVLTALATPALVELVDVKADIEKKATLGLKNIMEKKVLKVDRPNNVETYDLINDPKGFLGDAQKLSSSINNAVNAFGGMRK